jgi:toxin YoeB
MTIQFAAHAWDDYVYWQQTDPKMVRKINDLIKDCLRSPFAGLGKPEPLKHQLAGYWSRRITGEHRFVYRMEGKTLTILQLRYHYA